MTKKEKEIPSQSQQKPPVREVSLPSEPKKRRKVAIVGYASSSKDKAPFNDPTWEIWGINDLYLDIPRYDRWYQIHDEVICRSKDRRDPNHWEWLRACKKPVFMQDTHPEILNSQKFPLREIVAKFGWRYFTNSVAYMIAHALYEGVDELGVFGVDMLQASEYAGQLACCEAWLGLAQGMGVVLHVPKESALLKANFWYGYQDRPAIGGISEDHMLKEVVRLNGEIGKLDRAVLDLQLKREFCRGAQHQTQFLLQHIAHFNRGGRSLCSNDLLFPDETVRGRIESALGGRLQESAWTLIEAAGLGTAVEYGEISAAEAANRIAHADQKAKLGEA